MIPTYVLDTGALIAAERGKSRASRFFRLAHVGLARLLVPLPVVAEWWRGRTDVREAILGSTEVISSVVSAKAAGVALASMRDVDARATIDAVVMATAALLGAVVVTGDAADFEVLAAHFPGVTGAELVGRARARSRRATPPYRPPGLCGRCGRPSNDRSIGVQRKAGAGRCKRGCPARLAGRARHGRGRRHGAKLARVQTASAPEHRRFSAAEVLRMVEEGILREDEPVELLDGELLLTPP